MATAKGSEREVLKLPKRVWAELGCQTFGAFLAEKVLLVRTILVKSTK